MNSGVVFALDAILAGSAVLAATAQIVVEALTPTLARRHAYCARVVLGAVLSGHMMSPPAETVPSVGTRQPLEF